jgi:hypothetical protein
MRRDGHRRPACGQGRPPSRPDGRVGFACPSRTRRRPAALERPENTGLRIAHAGQRLVVDRLARSRLRLEPLRLDRQQRAAADQRSTSERRSSPPRGSAKLSTRSRKRLASVERPSILRGCRRGPFDMTERTFNGRSTAAAELDNDNPTNFALRATPAHTRRARSDSCAHIHSAQAIDMPGVSVSSNVSRCHASRCLHSGAHWMNAGERDGQRRRRRRGSGSAGRKTGITPFCLRFTLSSLRTTRS